MRARSAARAIALIGLATIAAIGCADRAPTQSSARVVTQRSDLPGGVRALGDVGDVVLENDRVRVVIQAEGFSRGFGVYGGGLIDAVPVPVGDPGPTGALRGVDAFGELFPSFFLQAVAVDEVVIVNDGADGRPARVEARGGAGDFLELAGLLNRLAVGSHENPGDSTSTQRLRYAIGYELAPGDSHVRITFRIENVSDEALDLPGALAKQILNILGVNADDFTVPIGDVALFGAATKVFIPGIGFDLRFGLERAYAEDVQFPAFPGLVTPWVAARGDGVSYAIVAAPSDDNYLWSRRDDYAPFLDRIERDSMLIPFVASGFLGIFYAAAPTVLEPGAALEVEKYFVIGSGDIGSALDEIHRIRGVETGRVAGNVVDAVSGAAANDTSVFVYERADDRRRTIFAQYDVQPNGSFAGTLEPGAYSLRVAGGYRPTGDFIDVDVRADETSAVRLAAPAVGRVVVHTLDEQGRRLPAKASAVGTYDFEFADRPSRSFLFDLELGEPYRPVDMDPDTEDPQSRRYIEAVGRAADGVIVLDVRPGEYTIVSSRGPEYDTASTTVTVTAGGVETIAHTLHRVVDTRGWISLDVHLHTVNSIDAGIDVEDQLVSVAAEGVEWAVSTDHNFVTDYEPHIARLGLLPWLRSSVGLELTTLESGHFNGYPLNYEVGAITHGAFEWSRRPPEELFEELRSRGRYSPEETIVQVNHPRDSIIGYFGQYDRDGLTTEQETPSFISNLICGLTGGGSLSPTGPAFCIAPEEPPTGPLRCDTLCETTFSLDFDALEVLNGKLFWQIHHFRVPAELPEGLDLPDRLPPAGSILLDSDRQVAFPGAVDDWYNLLNLGHRFIAVASSDSHGHADEPGYFRTMVYTGEDDPLLVDERDLMRRLRSRRVVGTNGPMLDLWVGDAETGVIGAELVHEGGSIPVGVRLSAAPWVGVTRINIVRNGVIADAIAVDPERDLAREPLEVVREIAMAVDDNGEPIDSWFVAQAIGHQNMFPVVTPLELPPLDLTDAIGSLAGPLGFGDGDFGDLVPAETFAVTAYALTNPVWVRTDADREFQPPGVVPVAVRSLPENDPGFDSGPFDKVFVPGERVDPRPVRPTTVVDTEPRSLRDALRREAVGEGDIRRLIHTFHHHGL